MSWLANLGPRRLSPHAKNIRRAIQWLEGNQLTEVTTWDLAPLFDESSSLDATTSRRVAQNLVRLGVLERRLPGRYRVLRPGALLAAPVTLGVRLDHWLGPDEYAVAYASAMALHGLPPPIDASQRLHVMRRIPCSRLPTELVPQVWDHQRTVRRLNDLVRVSHATLGTLTVRSPLRTLFDVAERPKHAGGIVRVAQFLSLQLQHQSAAELAEALPSDLPRQAVCRLGYLLELAGTPAEALRHLRKRAAGKFFLLEPEGGPGPLQRVWRLRLNVPEEALRAALATGTAPAPAG